MRRVRDSLIGVALFCALGWAVQACFGIAHIAFSSAVAALIVALLLLFVRRRIDAPVARGSALLLRAFPLFFVPACVGIVDLRATLQSVWIGVCAVLVLSTGLGLAAGVLCGRFLERAEGRV